MDAPLPQQQYQIEFEKNNAPFYKNYKGKARHFFQDTPNPYLLDASDNIPRLFFIRNQTIVKLKYKHSKQGFVGDVNEKPFQGYDDYDPDEESELHCVKISPCQRYLAVMTDQYIWIYTLAPNFDIMKVDERNVDFKLEANQFDDYVAIQWPPLSESYIKNPHFLSIDSANKIRLHYIKDNTTVVPNHEEVHFASFSHDGERILGVNLANELCFMDPNTLETLYKKTIPELTHYKNAHVAHVFQIDRNHIAIGAFYSLPNQNNKNCLCQQFQSIVFILSGDFMTADGEIRAYGYRMDTAYEILEDLYPSFKFQYLKEQNLLFYTHSDYPDINTLYFSKHGNMIQFPTIHLAEGTVRGFVLLKSLLRESTKKRKTQLDGVTKVIVHPKISVIILTSEGRFLQHDLKEIRPERDYSERKIRKICKESTLEKALSGAVPNFIPSSEGLEEQKQEKQGEEGAKLVEDKTLLNGQYTIGPSLFMKLEDRPNLFSKEKEPTVICLDDDETVKKKNVNKKLEMNNRAFPGALGHENKSGGGFVMFPFGAKKDDKEKESKSRLFGGKENDGKLANRAFNSGLFNAENIIKVKENDGAGKKDEGRSTLFGDFKLEKKEEVK